MIHHPQIEVLKKYSCGEVSPPLAAMVSAHVELCEECRSSYRKMLKNAADDFVSTSFEISGKELDTAFDLVMDKIEAPKEQRPHEEDNLTINVSGQVIQLPRSMNFLKEQVIPWKEFGNKNAIAPVVMGPKGNFYLIYIGPGEQVPQHTHTGLEYSYVVAGSYDDGISSFSTGDFSVGTSKTIHSPKATSDDGCLVISWVEGRLNYFDGWLKPLNSILWWYLHRA